MNQAEQYQFVFLLPGHIGAQLEERAAKQGIEAGNLITFYITQGLAMDRNREEDSNVIAERVKRLASVVDVMVHDVDSLTQKVNAMEKERGEL